MSTEHPLVTVLLPCYNARQFLGQTLDSLVGQTYRNLEILAIDDGSKDGTSEILSKYADRDSRIRLEPNDRNRGLITTLNRGMALASGSLVARMDADDIAVPWRIESQVNYFAKHPETDVLSSDVSYIGLHGQLLGNPPPHRFSSRTLRFLLFFVNPLCHPTVMGRRAAFLTHLYATDAVHSEDLELWHRMVEEGVVIRNLPERLLRFRSNPNSVSSQYDEQQSTLSLRISAAAIERYFDLRLDPDVQRILTNRMVHGRVRGTNLKTALSLLRQMRKEYIRRENLDRSEIELIDAFTDRHMINIIFHSYKRSSEEDSARRLAAFEMMLLTLRNPVPAWMLAAQKGRERISK